MDVGTLINIGLVLIFILIGGVFAGTELALVSLREGQIDQLAERGRRGQRVAGVARDPNTFLAAVQIGVTVAGFFSAAYGASTIAPDLAPALTALGLPEQVAGTVALVAMTLIIAFLSLVLGELVPKRLALQKSSGIALAVGPPLASFATLMRPVIWLLSVTTNGVLRLLGVDPKQANEEMSEQELRDLVVGHEGIPDPERQILRDVFAAGERTLSEVMRPRHEVSFVPADMSTVVAARLIADHPYSRYPVTGEGVDDILGFVHVRDVLLAAATEGERPVRELVRSILVLPGTNAALGAITTMQRERIHIAVVIDEYGGTDGIVTLEDLVEELVGEIEDEYDPPTATADATVDGGLTLEEVAETTGLELPEGSYETIGGFVQDEVDRVPVVGDMVAVEGHRIEVVRMDGHRVESVHIIPDPEDDTEDASISGGRTSPTGD
ncbi:hemolysin family protein [Propionibacteriaceae bacterium Y1700]|uniref:hemolysin family protein n=1 Tax=Microlunatus sp. Y1700 TaxID=3418487 RepID=UPI003DA76A34